MNGQAFGGFANGLMGGLSLGMAAKNFKASMPNNKPDMSAPASGSTAAGYSGDLSNFQATPNGSVDAANTAPKPQEDGDFLGGQWESLKGIASDIFGSDLAKASPAAGVVEKGLEISPAAKILGGGLGGTILGKIGGGKLLGGGILGGLGK